jgi:hypothetical protein
MANAPEISDGYVDPIIASRTVHSAGSGACRSRSVGPGASSPMRRSVGGRRARQSIGAPMSPQQLTIAGLERWLASGAHWRVVSISGQRVVVDLCTCMGEPIERVSSEDPGVIEYLCTPHPELGLEH